MLYWQILFTLFFTACPWFAATPSHTTVAAATSFQQPAQASRSLIVFLRPKRFFGSGLTPSIYLDGRQLARLDNGRYFSVRAAPGKHKLESSMKHTPPLEIEVKDGDVSYIEMAILAGTWRGGGRLIPDGAAEAKAELAKLKPLDEKWVIEKEMVVFDTDSP